jgi:hypothetical protein
MDKIWKEYWSEYTLPDQSSPIIDTVVVDDNDKVISYGQVRHFAEMMFFPDMGVSSRTRLNALKLTIAEGFRGIDKAGYKEVYMMCKDVRFARLIAKHFDFTLVDNPGVLLVRKMD